MEEIDGETLILTNQTHFLITHIWDALNVNANRMKQVSNKKRCLNLVCALSARLFLSVHVDDVKMKDAPLLLRKPESESAFFEAS